MFYQLQQLFVTAVAVAVVIELTARLVIVVVAVAAAVVIFKVTIVHVESVVDICIHFSHK